MIIKARFTSLMSTSLLNLEGIVYCCAWGDKCGMKLILSLNVQKKKAPGGGALFKFNLTIKGGTFIVKRRIII